MNSSNSRPANSRFPKRRTSTSRLTVALNRHRKISCVVAVALCVVAATATAIGCGWVGTEHSVRFNGWMDERDMQRLPPLPFKARDAKPQRAANHEAPADDVYAVAQRRANEIDALWTQAEKVAGQNEPGATRILLRDYLARTNEACTDRYNSPSDCIARRNSAADQLDALAALETGASPQAVRAYLDARVIYDSGAEANGAREKQEDGELFSADELRNALNLIPRHASLDDNVAYLRAAMLYRESKYDEAVKAFNQLARQYPRSEKREAAIFMAGRASLKQSRSFTGEHATAEESCADCRDDAWRASRLSFRRLQREYPRGRFAADARGWLGYLHLRVGDTAEGLAEYYRLLSDETNRGGREEASISLRLTRDDASDADMQRLEAILADEPRVALTYAYHEIYNHALRGHSTFDFDIPDEQNPFSFYKDNYDSEYYQKYNEWEGKEQEKLARETERRELARVSAFATRMMRRYPQMKVGGGFALRVAQSKLELDDPAAALMLARRALALGLNGDEERAGAWWVKGVAEHRLRDFAAARQTFTALTVEFPAGDLTEGARRLLAMAAEDGGDLNAALEHYLALDYTNDVAYFVDVLMTPEQLSSFISSRPQLPQRDVLLYSLGVRYLRLHRFDEARSAYAQVRTNEKKGYEYFSFGNGCMDKWRVEVSPCSDPKEPDEEASNIVPGRWLMRDMRTMEEIEHLERLVAQAVGQEAKAEALYQLAGYFYEASELTFYNPAAWRGGRFYAFYYDQELRSPNEAQLMRRYMEEHEPLVHALNVYLEAARLYPRTRAARDSLYTAAVIHERLAAYLLYWPVHYRQSTHPGERLVTYKDVRREYPLYQMPRGTYGWEPLTRTVNGGPGWDAPPKPQPRPTLGERVKRQMEKVWRWWSQVWKTRMRRPALIGLAALSVGLAFQLARRTRRLMRVQLARLGFTGAPRSDARTMLRSSDAGSTLPEWTSRRHETARLMWHRSCHRLWQGALDPRTRLTLVLNLFAHGLLAAFMYALAWAVRSA